MSLKERPKVARGTGMPCSIASASSALDADDLATLHEWLSASMDDPERRADWQIAADLYAETGVRVAEQQVGRHRRRTCRCYQGVPKS